MLDFSNALSHRVPTRSADEDMKLAWVEVLSLMPQLPAQASGADEPDDNQDVAAASISPAVRPSSPAGQGELFEVAELSNVGFRGPTACAAAGISYRQLDYWARTGLVEPSVRPATGSGAQRLYGFRDILMLKLVKRLLDTGIGLQQIRAALAYVRGRSNYDLATLTLMSDGFSIYAATSPDDVVDLLQGGQAVFGVALGRIWREVEGSLIDLPSEPANTYIGQPRDEEAKRGRERTG